MLPTKFWFVWPSGFREDDSNVKNLQLEDEHQVMIKAHMVFGQVIKK